MKKNLAVTILSILSFMSFANSACPILVGRYSNCFSEVTKVKGDYIIDQHQESSYEVFNVEYIDDETEESRKDEIRTNGQQFSRKENIPKVGIRIRVEAKARCINNAAVSNADAYVFGAKVGSFVTSISRNNKQLKSTFDGSYLGTPVHKIILCDLVE